MRRVVPQENWPASWLGSYHYDLQEIYGEIVHHGHTYAYQNRFRQTLSMISQVLQPPGRILDVAAAQGNFSLALAEQGYDVTWNDLRDELSGYVALKHERGKLSYMPGNVFDLKVQEFDLVLITEVIEHVAHPDQFLKQISNLVRPGGWIVMTTPNGEYCRNTLPKFSECPDPSVFESSQFKPDADGHIFLLHADEVHSLAKESGLEVIEIRYFTTPLTNGFMKTEPLLHILPKPVVDLTERLCKKLPPAAQRRLFINMGAILRRGHQ